MPINQHLLESDEAEEEEETIEDFFKGYEIIIGKLRSKIIDTSKSDTKTIHRYGSNNLSGNTVLFLYIILESVTINPTALIRGISLFRMIKKDASFIFYSSFATALRNLRYIQGNINNIIILFLQICYSSFLINKNEANELLLYYLTEEEKNERKEIFYETLVFPKDHLLLNIEKGLSILKDKLKNSEFENIKLQNQIKELSEIEDQLKLSNDFMKEANELDQMLKNGREFSDKYIAISSIAYIFGPKCYNFLRKYFPLPHETTLRKHISPEIEKYTNSLVDIKGLEQILHEFIGDQKMNVTLAVDAAAFKNVKGDSILFKFPDLKSINPNSIYNTIFVYYIQPINVDIKPFPIHIEITENGAASQNC